MSEATPYLSAVTSRRELRPCSSNRRGERKVGGGEREREISFHTHTHTQRDDCNSFGIIRSDFRLNGFKLLEVLKPKLEITQSKQLHSLHEKKKNK